MARTLRTGASGLARGRVAMICGLLLVASGFAAPSIAEPVGQSSDAAVWTACQQAPTRRCVLRHAVDAALTLPIQSHRIDALRRVANAQFAVGLVQDASETVDLLGANGAKDPVFSARIKAAAGKLDEAASLARMIDDPKYRGVTVGSIAVAEGEAGSIDAALRRVQSVQDDTERAVAIRRAAWGLRFVACQRGEDGKIAEALRQSQSIGQGMIDRMSRFGLVVAHPSMSVPALEIIVDAQIRTGKVAEAVKAARSVEDSEDRRLVFASVLVALAGAGRVSEALRIALTIDDTDERAHALYAALENPRLPNRPINPLQPPRPIYPLLSDRPINLAPDPHSEIPVGPQGKVDPEALVVAKSFRDTWERSMALRIVAEAQAKAGEPAQAGEAEKLIDDARIRFYALLDVGLAQAKAGQAALAVASFGEAAQMASKRGAAHPTLFANLLAKLGFAYEGGPVGDYLLPEVGVAEAKANLIAEAVGLAESIKDQQLRGQVLSEVARAQARAGRTAEALQTIQLAETLGFRPIPSGEEIVVEGLADGGHVGEVIQTAERLLRSPERDRALREAAISLARAGNASGAIQAAQTQEKTSYNSSFRIETLAQVALALRQAGADAGAAAAIHIIIHIIMDSAASEPLYASEQLYVPGQLTDLSYALRE
jgi:hypothetical protein